MCHSWGTKKALPSHQCTSEPRHPLFALTCSPSPLPSLSSPSEWEKRKAGGRREGQHRYKQKASCLRWKQKEMQRRKTLSFLQTPFLLSFVKWKMCVEALPFPVSGPVASGWCCDWSWMDGCRRTGKEGPHEKGQADGPSTCRRTECRQPGWMCAYVCVCAYKCAWVCMCVYKFNLISSPSLLMRDVINRVMKESELWCFGLYSGILCVCQEKESRVWKWDTCNKPHIHKTEKGRKKEAGVHQKNTPPPLFLPPTLTREEKWAWFGAKGQYIRLPASRVLLMRLDQGRSTGSSKLGRRLESLWGIKWYPSGQSRPMVGLHLGAKCLVCVEPFPGGDREEDASAKWSWVKPPVQDEKYT